MGDDYIEKTKNCFNIVDTIHIHQCGFSFRKLHLAKIVLK